MRARHRAVAQRERTGGRITLAPFKELIPGKTVLRHGIGRALMPQLVVLQPTNNRKQQRRVARPCRPGLPDQFIALRVLQRTEFRAMRFDGRLDAAAAQRKTLLAHVSPSKTRDRPNASGSRMKTSPRCAGRRSHGYPFTAPAVSPLTR